ncbi:hypothetical protein Nepgr_001903 [Nepenthes gracilis]|uniref:Uncharacterized protein n=1 Tax=Nepenthes gracilis TaxID=150966 RepID=A0AAD3RXE4_NEPGR|nr:hypothetical protein Nepgr_001903 [Nepenthes gracilis]
MQAFCILLEAALKDAKQSKDGTDVEITTLRCEVENAKQEAKAVAAQLHGGVGLHDFGAWLPSMFIREDIVIWKDVDVLIGHDTSALHFQSA